MDTLDEQIEALGKRVGLLEDTLKEFKRNTFLLGVACALFFGFTFMQIPRIADERVRAEIGADVKAKVDELKLWHSQIKKHPSADSFVTFGAPLYLTRPGDADYPILSIGVVPGNKGTVDTYRRTDVRLSQPKIPIGNDESFVLHRR